MDLLHRLIQEIYHATTAMARETGIRPAPEHFEVRAHYSDASELEYLMLYKMRYTQLQPNDMQLQWGASREPLRLVTTPFPVPVVYDRTVQKGQPILRCIWERTLFINDDPLRDIVREAVQKHGGTA